MFLILESIVEVQVPLHRLPFILCNRRLRFYLSVSLIVLSFSYFLLLYFDIHRLEILLGLGL